MSASGGAARLGLGVAVAQPDRPVEDEPAGGGVLVEIEIALPFELNRRLEIADRERRLEAAVLQQLERVRVQIGEEIAAAARIGPIEKQPVETHLGGNRLRSRHP